jgi:DNA repair exonuclease SbcCD nuclease subunit
MKFIHTADWQIGMKAAHVGAVAEVVREERMEAGKRVIEAAKEKRADFIIIAGDVFEDNGVDRILVQRTADILDSFGKPVYIIPGNHDPLVPGSVWEHPAWKEIDSVYILRESKPFEIPGGVIFPCPVLDKYSRKDPTAWIEAQKNTGVRIGIAHGNISGVIPGEQEHPISEDVIATTGLDYLALGHWHSTLLIEDGRGNTRAAYSGTHEPTGFGERESGYVLLVEIERKGSIPAMDKVKTGRLNWHTFEETIVQNGDLQAVREKVDAIPDPASTLLQLRIQGVLDSSEREVLERIKELLPSRFLYSYLDEGIRPSPTDGSWVESIPPGIVKEVATQLLQWSNPSYQGDRPEGAAPDIASRALLELFAAMKEGEG